MIVDEEQHFGVAHKERLKALKADVHVLTLTATPIPRTLQLALSGVRDLSLITTPPIDRLAVRTFVTPFDPLVIREAILREHYRGGQSFYVAPRIADLREAQEFLKTTVPEVKSSIAHGQMAPTTLEDVMTSFYDRKIDVLVSTNIVESVSTFRPPTRWSCIAPTCSAYRSFISCAGASAAPSSAHTPI